MCSYTPRKWFVWLPLTEWWYNTSFYSIQKLTPFKALYGFSPPQCMIPNSTVTTNAMVEDYMHERMIMTQVIRDTLTTSQNRMKQMADLHRTDKEFMVGDWVYLKLQPYRQSTTEIRKNMKLAPNLYGSYQITAKIGIVAYKLRLPEGSRIHHVFHVSQLQKKVGSNRFVCSELPLVDHNGLIKVELVSVLDKRKIKRKNKAVTQVLIKWSHTLPEDSTWEDFKSLTSRFPFFDPCGQGSTQDGGIVTNPTHIKRSKIIGPYKLNQERGTRAKLGFYRF